MMAEPAGALGIHLRALIEDDDGATGQVVPDVRVGDPADLDAVSWLVDGADVVTFEHEHIPAATLEFLSSRLPVEPSGEALLFAQDKIEMRKRLTSEAIACPRWMIVADEASARQAFEQLGTPMILKVARGGYDGRGVGLVDSIEEVLEWLERVDGAPVLAEEAINFDREISVLQARSRDGEIVQWEVTETIQAHGMCDTCLVPARELSETLRAKALAVGREIATRLDVTGVLAVEMFVVGDRVLVNELAMRPHNSGHWTIEGAVTSQFENHLRAVLNLPLGETTLRQPAVVMANVVGADAPEPREAYAHVMRADPGAKIHYYGKGFRPGRKLGHVTVCSHDVENALERARAARDKLVADERTKR